MIGCFQTDSGHSPRRAVSQRWAITDACTATKTSRNSSRSVRGMLPQPYLSSKLDLQTDAATIVWVAYLVLRASIRTFAVGPDEAGFWPVISNPSVTTWTPQFLTLEKVAPRPSSSSSTRKGTTLVRPTSASSPSVNPVTFLPSTSGLPAAVFTWRKTPGAWQTSATGFRAARKDSISLMELRSSARSHIGLWPPG